LYEFGPGLIEPYDYAYELACIDYENWIGDCPNDEEGYDLFCAEREPFLDYYAELV